MKAKRSAKVWSEPPTATSMKVTNLTSRGTPMRPLLLQVTWLVMLFIRSCLCLYV